MMQPGKDYGVRVIRAYQHFEQGQVIFPTGLLRSHLLDRKLVEEVKPDEAPKKARGQTQKRPAA